MEQKLSRDQLYKLSISVVAIHAWEQDAGFDSVFREQRKGRATDSNREKTDRDRYFCQGRMLSQDTSSIPMNISPFPGSGRQEKLWHLVTLRCQQAIVHSQDFLRSVQGWDLSDFQAEFFGALSSAFTPFRYCHQCKGYSFPPQRSVFLQRAEQGHSSHFMNEQVITGTVQEAQLKQAWKVIKLWMAYKGQIVSG